MPRNGSGIYGPPPGTAAMANTTIESADYNAVVTDMSQALTESVNVGGTAPFQANQSMGNNKLIAMAPGTAAADSVNLAQAQSAIVAHAASVGGTADAITASFSPAFSTYTARMRFRFAASGANTAVAPTINVDGLGTKTIKKLNSVTLAVDDIGGAGHVCDCVYNGTDVILLNPALAAGDRANTFAAKQTYNGPVVKGTTVLADAATVAWDLATGADFQVTITSNRTLGAFTNGTVGQEGILRVIQDGTGGWTLNLSNAVYDFWGPSIENVARGAGDVTEYNFKVLSSGSMFLKRRGSTSIREGGRDFLSEQTAAASAIIDFVLIKWLALYDRFEIDFDNVLPSADNTALWLRTSTNGGSSYDSTAADYKWALQRSRIGTNDGTNDSNATKIELINNDNSIGMSNVSGETTAGTVTIHSPSVAQRCKILWRTVHIPADIATFVATITGIGIRDAAADVDAIRFLPSSGNIASGTFRLYGIRK
jgi:hypothetical protein